MTRWSWAALVLLLGAGSLLCLQVTRRDALPQTAAADSSVAPTPGQEQHQPAAQPAGPARTSVVDRAAESVAPAATTSVAPPTPPSPVAYPSVPETAESSGLPPATILENMRTTIRQYGSMFGGNPVGTNPEITSALQGNNPKEINFLKQDGNRVNANGELVDTWGTPYFFHQISAQEMEIRSAGPDRVMYTADDLVAR